MDRPPLGLSAEISTVAGILSGPRVLRIPAYQRPYVWSPVQVGRLMDDLVRAFERAAPFYFVGHVVFIRNERRELEIADGQQRIATLTMFLAWAREQLPRLQNSLQPLIFFDAGPNQDKPRLRLRRADENFFHEFIQLPGNMTRLQAIEEQLTDSQIQMSNAIQAMSETFDGWDEVQLTAFVRFLCRLTIFDVMTADERGGAATVFPTLNDTGVGLSGPDMLKQDLLERANLSDAEADELASAWERLEDKLGRTAFAQLISEILPVVFTAEPLRSPGDLNYLRQQILKETTPQEFLKVKLPLYGVALVELRAGNINAGPHSGEVNRRVKGLFQLPESLWLAPAVAFLAKNRSGSNRIARFFQALDSLAHANFLKTIRSDRRESRFLRVIALLDDDQKLFGPEGPFALTGAERRDLVDKINGGFNKDSGRRRIMALRINAALPGRVQLSLSDDATVEHVLPLSPCKGWKMAFPNEQVRRDCSRIYGNMVLLSRDKNQRAGNALFPLKRSIYFEDDGTPVHAMTKDIEGVSEWTAPVVQARQERLMAALFQDWGI